MAKITNATSEAANQTAQKTAENPGMLQDPIFLGVVAAAVLLLPIALVLKRYSSAIKDRFKPEYQGKSLQERLNEKQIKPAKEFGQKPKKKVDYGPSELGNCEKIYSTSEKTAEGILDQIHNQDPQDIEDLQKEDLSEENDEFEQYTMIIGPTSFTSRLKMKMKSSDPVKNPHLSVYSPPVQMVTIGDRIVISDKVDWNYSGGIYYSKDVQGITTMYNFSALSLIDDLTKVFANKGEITQALNEKFAEWKNKKEVENQAFIDYMKEKEDIDSDKATD